MRITPVNYNNYFAQKNSIKNPSFQSTGCYFIQYKDYKGISRGGQVNTSLRDDLNYKLFAKTVKQLIAPPKPKNIIQKIKQTLKIEPEAPWKKAKIYSLAGADGTEAYAIADAIIGEIGFEKAKEHVFPIYVSDVTEWVINKYGKAGIINFLPDELDKLPNIKQFFSIKESKASESTYAINPEFRECFEFEVADLQEKIKNLPEPQKNEKYFFVIRNCLADAFDKMERDRIFESITRKYPENAFVTLGGYDLNKMEKSVFGAFSPWSVGLKHIGNNTFMSCGIFMWSRD